MIKSYNITQVQGDRYAGEFPRELFRKHDVSYEPSDLTKSDLLRELLPLLNSGHVTLPKHDRLVAQIVGLERRVSRGGKDSISHPDHAGAHDDLANAVAGAAYCANKRGYDPTNLDWIDGPDPTNEEERRAKEKADAEYFQGLRLRQHIMRHARMR